MSRCWILPLSNNYVADGSGHLFKSQVTIPCRHQWPLVAAVLLDAVWIINLNSNIARPIMKLQHGMIYSTLLLLCFQGVAQAQDVSTERRTATVTAGSRTVIYQSAFVDPDCTTAALPRLKILDAGKHGKIQIVHEKVFPNFKRDNPRFKCNNRKVEGASIYYTPNPKFRGSDKVKLRESSESEASVWEMTFRIAVVE
ncbi:hypothetical protein EV128_13433 [Rhizobium azibense]|nr:hypothetical protein EV128_13433 [Rhizobium azibense]